MTRNHFRELVAHLRPAISLPALDGLPAVDDALIHFADARHRVGPLLHIAVSNGSPIEPGAEDILHDIYRQNGRRLLKRKAIEKRLERMFADAGIFSVRIKGPGLAEQIYANASERPSKDIDILVGEQDVVRAIALMHEHKYAPKKRRSQRLEKQYMSVVKDITFTDPQFGVQIEMHRRLLLAEPEAFTGDFLASLDGHTIPEINSDHYVLYLIMHGAISSWPRLKWVVDMALLMRKTATQAKNIYALARHYRCVNAVTGSLMMISDIFPEAVTDEWKVEMEKVMTEGRKVSDKAQKLSNAFLIMLRRDEPIARKIGFPFADMYIWDGGIFSFPYAMRRLLRPIMLRL